MCVFLYRPKAGCDFAGYRIVIKYISGQRDLNITFECFSIYRVMRDLWKLLSETLCDQKTSCKHVSGFKRFQRYDSLKLRTELFNKPLRSVYSMANLTQ